MFSRIKPPLELAQLGVANIAIVTVEAQIADKVCAMFEQHSTGHSSRWRDLADIAMMSQQLDGIHSATLIDAIHSETLMRPKKLATGLPKAFELPATQLAEWRLAWGKGGRNVPITIDGAITQAVRFLDPILADRATGVWDRNRGIWT